MNIRLIDKITGRNYFILEVGIHIPSFFMPIKKWLFVKQNELVMWYNKIRWGAYSQTGKGHYVWRNGCWVSGKEIDRSIFHSFFDYGMSKVVSSTADIKKHEKEGWIYTTHEEAERESAKRRYKLKQEYKEKIKKDIRNSLQEVARGKRSYYNEHMKRIPEDMKLKAARMKASGMMH